MIASLALAVSLALNSTRCELVTARSVRAAVNEILADPDSRRGMQKADSLLGLWFDRCPLTNRTERKDISRSVSRLLVRPELRSYTAIILYQLGRDAVVSRPAVHAAYVDHRRRLKELGRTQPYVVGPAPQTIKSLGCLEGRLKGPNPGKKICPYLDGFANPERLTAKRERG